jgi:hypothetical protein
MRNDETQQWLLDLVANHRPVELPVEPPESVLDVLRDQLRLTGTKTASDLHVHPRPPARSSMPPSLVNRHGRPDQGQFKGDQGAMQWQRPNRLFEPGA